VLLIRFKLVIRFVLLNQVKSRQSASAVRKHSLNATLLEEKLLYRILTDFNYNL